MTGIFDSFNQGFTAGRQIRDDRMKRNALLQAGEAFKGGDYGGAANALFASDPNAAIQMQQYGAGLQRQQQADELAGQQRERDKAMAGLKAFAQAAQGLKSIPLEGRFQAAQQIIPQLAAGLGADPASILKDLTPEKLTNENLDSFSAMMMDPEAYQSAQVKAADSQRADARLDLEGRRVAAIEAKAFAPQGGGSAAPPTRPMTPEEKAQWGYPAGAIVGVDTTTGKPVVPQGAGKTMTPTKASDLLRSAKDKAMDVKESIAAARKLADKSLRFGPIEIGTTGIGSLTAVMPGTPAADLQAQIDTILANIGFQELSQMRQQSPTGAAVGSVTEKELNFLQSTIASLKTSQSKDQFLANLNRVERAYDRVLKALESDYARDYAGGEAVAPGAVPPGDYVWNPATGRMEPAQ